MRHIYQCICGAQAACHKGSYRPKGLCAAPETHQARSAAHGALDALWKAKANRTGADMNECRVAAYKWLAEQMNLPVDDCHISHFNAAQARRVVELCEPFLARLRRTAA